MFSVWPRRWVLSRMILPAGIHRVGMLHVAPRKARLVTQLIAGRPVQDALDILKFTRKRAAEMVSKALQAAIADADEQEADVDNLYVSEARVDDAGIRIGTKRWIAKDRGRAHSLH